MHIVHSFVFLIFRVSCFPDFILLLLSKLFKRQKKTPKMFGSLLTPRGDGAISQEKTKSSSSSWGSSARGTFSTFGKIIAPYIFARTCSYFETELLAAHGAGNFACAIHAAVFHTFLFHITLPNAAVLVFFYKNISSFHSPLPPLSAVNSSCISSANFFTLVALAII